MNNAYFRVLIKNDYIYNLSHPDDQIAMNWVAGETPWGTIQAPDGLALTVQRQFKQANRLCETYIFHNATPFDIFIGEGDIGIYTPFNDDYTNEDYMKQRCNTHIWCGSSFSYVCALRMGGEAPHLGLVLTHGSINTYSIHRNLQLRSNDRGDFILHPSPFQLSPNDDYILEWELFWHNGIEDFYQQLRSYPHYLDVSASRYVLFSGETALIRLMGNKCSGDITISKDSQAISYDRSEQGINFEFFAIKPGIHSYSINIDNYKTGLSLYVLPEFADLLEARCKFIVRHQQYSKQGSHLDGAYLTYDMETKQPVYSHVAHDHNGGRERLAMGVIIARYLQIKKDAELHASLEKYINYVLRELFDEDTGIVYNDIIKNNDWDRLYNYPWMSTFFLEVYKFIGLPEYLLHAYKALLAYYKKGGTEFSGIDIPMEKMISLLRAAGYNEESEIMLKNFRLHGENIIRKGANYDKSEVNYEQSIVAPAVNCLLQLYLITEDGRYLRGAEGQMRILELFNGRQPDYHLYEVAIRHWDGYWFGKRKLYGDTFPHYWSSLTGNAYHAMGRATGNHVWFTKAEHSLRGSLSLFFPDGSASCACVFPLYVNGQRAAGYMDPWANDQDWALYYMLEFLHGAQAFG